MTVEQVTKLIEYMKGLNLSAYPIAEVQQALRQFSAYPINVTDFHIGNVIYRIRPNTDGKSFTKASDLSYKPQQLSKTFQRANSPEKTMFYGSIIPQENLESEIDMARVIAATEASSLIRNKQTPDGVEVVSFGKWRVLETISLGTVTFSELSRNITPYAINRAKSLLELLKSSPEKEQQGLLMMNYIAEEFSKKEIRGDFDYLVSALFTEKLLGFGFDGVIFPSVRADEKGMNLAIIPEVVDTKMRIEGVVEWERVRPTHLRKRGDIPLHWRYSLKELYGFISASKNSTMTIAPSEPASNKVELSREEVERLYTDDVAA